MVDTYTSGDFIEDLESVAGELAEMSRRARHRKHYHLAAFLTSSSQTIAYHIRTLTEEPRELVREQPPLHQSQPELPF
jgi:hypothetical protein